MIRRASGLVLVIVGVYLAASTESGAALFLGMALLAIGCLIFLGSSSSFGSRGAGEQWGAGNIDVGGSSGDGDGGE